MAIKPATVSLFDKYGYAVRRTASDDSHQNSPDEAPPRYIGKTSIYLLEGHQVPLKIWPYVLSHYIKLHGMVPHSETELSPDDFFSGSRPNVGDINRFGCQAYIRPLGRRRHKMDD